MCYTAPKQLCAHTHLCRDKLSVVVVSEEVAAVLKGNEKLMSRKVSFTLLTGTPDSHALGLLPLAGVLCQPALPACSEPTVRLAAASMGSCCLLVHGFIFPAAAPPLQELALVQELVARGQGHLFAAWPAPGTQVSRRSSKVPPLLEPSSALHRQQQPSVAQSRLQ